MLELVDNLVKMLDVAQCGSEETLLLVFTSNPVLERFHHHLELDHEMVTADVPEVASMPAKPVANEVSS